jgi:hypothetical protein
MPRYLLELDGVDDAARKRANALASERFPEIELEHAYVLDGASGVTEVWVCRAPSEAHVRRWVAATGLSSTTTRPVDADLAGRFDAFASRREPRQSSPQQGEPQP